MKYDQIEEFLDEQFLRKMQHKDAKVRRHKERRRDLTSLRLTSIKLGLLVNFEAPYVKDGVSRFINGIL